MRYPLWFLFGGALVFGQAAVAGPEEVQLTHAQTAYAIRLYYESRLQELKPKFRGHWTLRAYRISGESRYRDSLGFYRDYLQEEFAQYAGGLIDPILRARKISELLEPGHRSPQGKYGRRREVLAKVTDYLYMQQLLYLTFLIQSVGLTQQEGASYASVLRALRKFPFQSYLLEPELLLYNAAEMANAVYYLEALGIENFEKDFLETFQRVHSAKEAESDPILFENKIYGMTHLIIAASGYYQKPVSAKRFSWILDYFAENTEMIVTRLKPDVVAEVGLCFLLAGLADHPVVIKTREFVARSWDAASGMIPSVKGSTDLNHGEHRNVLAVMLLEGFEQLYPGPHLNTAEPLQNRG